MAACGQSEDPNGPDQWFPGQVVSCSCPAGGWRCGMSAAVKPGGFRPGDSDDELRSADPGSAGNSEDKTSEQWLAQLQ